MQKYISTEALHQQQETDPVPIVIDVRSEEEYAAGHIPGALHIPADELKTRLDALPKDRLIVPY